MREKLELKTHRLGVVLTTAWPLVLALLVVGVPTFFLMPAEAAMLVTGMMLLIVLASLLICVPMYMGVYLFLPATEYKGARLLARLGKHATETEICSISRSEILVRQNIIEKWLKICHIRQKGTTVYLRGVPEVEKVKAWLDANFPEKTAVMRYHEEVAQKGKKRRKK